MVASVPHLLFGGILMYYFGTYVLADWQAPPAVGPTFVDQYGLSPREREVIPLLNQGLSNREIAEKLGQQPTGREDGPKGRRSGSTG